MAMVGDRHRAGDSQPDERSCADAGRGEDQVSYGVDEGEGALLRLKLLPDCPGWSRLSLILPYYRLISRSAVRHSAALTMRPVGSTNQRSLLNPLPLSRATSQSASSVGGNGPRLAAGTPPTECRLSA